MCKTTNPYRRKQPDRSFEKYRNVTITLTISISIIVISWNNLIPRGVYYKQFFEGKKKRSLVWEGIWSLFNLKNKKSSNSLQLNYSWWSYYFKPFFDSSSVAKNLFEEMPKTLKHFNSYLQKFKLKVFFVITHNKGCWRHPKYT